MASSGDWFLRECWWQRASVSLFLIVSPTLSPWPDSLWTTYLYSLVDLEIKKDEPNVSCQKTLHASEHDVNAQADLTSRGKKHEVNIDGRIALSNSGASFEIEYLGNAS